MARKLLTGADLNLQRLINMADGSAPTDAVTLQQLQAMVRGLDWKASVRVATTSNVTLSGTQTIDGRALAAGDRVLLMGQTTASQNGIYVVSAGAWARANDANTNALVTSGLAVTATEGASFGDKAWLLTTDDPITLDTTALSFSQLGGGAAAYVAGSGLALSGSTFSVTPKTSGGIVVDGTGVSVDTAVVARRYSTAIGDGSTTAITVTHNLGTRDVVVGVRDASTFEAVQPDDIAATVNTVTLTFAAAPAASAYRATVIG